MAEQDGNQLNLQLGQKFQAAVLVERLKILPAMMPKTCLFNQLVCISRLGSRPGLKQDLPKY